MISLDETITTRLESHGARFEVLIDPDTMLSIKRGEFDGDLEKVIATEDVLENASRGGRLARNDLEKVFGATDPLQMIPKVVKRGKIQITAERHREMQEQKHKSLINRIAHNTVSPQMNDSSHPPERIEHTLEEVEFEIDPVEPVESQADDALDALRPVLPIKSVEVTVAVQLPAEYAGSEQTQIRNYGNLGREEWQDDGSWVGVITFPTGIQNGSCDKMNNITNGTIKTHIVKDEDEL